MQTPLDVPQKYSQMLLQKLSNGGLGLVVVVVVRRVVVLEVVLGVVVIVVFLVVLLVVVEVVSGKQSLQTPPTQHLQSQPFNCNEPAQTIPDRLHLVSVPGSSMAKPEVNSMKMTRRDSLNIFA